MRLQRDLGSEMTLGPRAHPVALRDLPHLLPLSRAEIWAEVA